MWCRLLGLGMSCVKCFPYCTELCLVLVWKSCLCAVMLAACSFLQKSRGTCCQCCQQRLPMNKDQDSFCDSNRVCPQARCSQDLWPQFVHSQSLLSSSFPEILFRRATPLMSRCVHADEKKKKMTLHMALGLPASFFPHCGLFLTCLPNCLPCTWSFLMLWGSLQTCAKVVAATSTTLTYLHQELWPKTC